MSKQPRAQSKVTMETHFEIVELRMQEIDAAQKLAGIVGKRKALENELQAQLEGKATVKSGRRLGRPKKTVPPKDPTPARVGRVGKSGHTGKVLAFLRRAKGAAVPLDTLKSTLGDKNDPAALSRALYSLKKRGKAKRLGHKSWAAAAMANA